MTTWGIQKIRILSLQQQLDVATKTGFEHLHENTIHTIKQIYPNKPLTCTKSRSECRCVQQAEIEEAPDGGKWGLLVLHNVSPI